MKNSVVRLLLSFILILSVNLIPFKNLSYAEESKSYLIVFKDNSIPNEATKLLNDKYNGLNINIIPEVGTVKLENVNNKDINYFQKKFKDQIKYIGKEERIKNFDDYNVNNINSTNIRSKTNYDSLSSLDNKLQNGELSQIFGWDTEKVTENGQSYKKQLGNHLIKVGVIDSGIDFNHPDLKNNIISKGKSFIPNVNDTEDHMGHGTMTAGAIAANGKLLGIGPNLGIVPYKVMDNWDDGAESAWVIDAIIQAANDNMDVINLSVGTYKSLNKKEDKAIIEGYSRAIKYAYKKGSIVVTAAGNEGYDTSDPSKLAAQMGLEGDKQIHLPGNNSHYIINVAATNKNDELSSFSNFGEITISAPGGDYGSEWESKGLIDPYSLSLVAYPTNLPQPYISQILNLPEGYTLNAGTSLAAPKVSGAVGVLLAESKEKGHKKLSIQKIEKIFRESSTDLGNKGNDMRFGNGLLNLNKALDSMK